MSRVSSKLFIVFAGLLIQWSFSHSAAAEQGHSYRLFDGRTLNGWTIENDCSAAVKDGMILLESGNGWLRSDHLYTDFALHVEWKALKGEGYDAGIYLRAGRQGNPFPKVGYQINLLQGKEGVIGGLPETGATHLVKPAGQWNTFDIRVVGDEVSLSVNGKPAYRTKGLTVPAGYVGIQVEVPKGGQFLLRNLRVTELSHRTLFNGRDLTGWEGAGQPAELCWTVRGGVLVGLKNKGPWLRTQEQYGDFNLRLMYRLEPGANSGIYVRVPPDGNHHRNTSQSPPAGFEVQILDDLAGKHRRLKDYQYSGSVYDIAGARRHVSRPPGEWNTLELNCRGHHISVVHNGTLIVEAAPEEYPLLVLRQLRGYLGLQNHGGGVEFRDIRIGPPLDRVVR